MNAFEIIQPTRIFFGEDHWNGLIQQLKIIAPNKRILLAYGGSSIQKSGFLDETINKLSDFSLFHLAGIEANPEYQTLMKGVATIKENNVEAVLAIGGGSVIDGVKFIVGASKYKGEPWDVLERKPDANFTDALPFGCILTLPATGSESNSGAVISRSEKKEKRTMGGPLFFPKFAWLNPTFLQTLPKRQIANGIVDAMVHTLEQYLTFKGENLLQERYAEGILSTLIEIAPIVMENPADKEAAAQLFYCANQALNGTLRCGVTTDWATHMIGHELTALYHIDHARTLAIVGPRLWEHLYDQKKAKLVQFGERVWKLSGTADEIARGAIAKTESFFQTLGIETRLSAYTNEIEQTAVEVKKRFEERGWLGLGEGQNVGPETAYQIVLATA